MAIQSVIPDRIAMEHGDQRTTARHYPSPGAWPWKLRICWMPVGRLV
jgi:hypothetical protein